MFIAILSWSGTYSGLCTGTQLMNISPSSLSLDGILDGFSDSNLGGIRANMVLMVKSWMSGRDAIHQSTHGTFPHCLSRRTGRDVYSACVSKDRLSLTWKEKLWTKICLQPHLKQGRTSPVERWHWSLFLSLTHGS